MRRLAKLVLALGLGAALLPVVVLTMSGTPEDGTEIRAGLATGTAPSADVPNPSALRRCRDLGRAALEDADCLALWAETRRRFLGDDGDAANGVPAPGDAGTTEPGDGGRGVEPPDGATDTGAPPSIPAR